MKLWHSFRKELLLASRSFYFWIEIFMAGLFLFLLVFVIPETFNTKSDEFIHLDVPAVVRAAVLEEFLDSDEDGKVAFVPFDHDGETVVAALYETEDARVHVLDDEAATIDLADKGRDYAGVMRLDDAGEVRWTYYLQGYETERLRNVYLALQIEPRDALEATFDAQTVRQLEADQVLLNDRENVIPALLTFNGSLMGLFIIASYIFLDKKEGVIKAYAVTASSVWQYLASKVGVIMLTSTVTSIIIVAPIMRMQPNYPLMILFLLATGFAASALGLVLTSYYDNIQQAFGTLYLLVIALMLPNIAYFIPSWSPTWMTLIPTHPMLEGFKEILLPGGDGAYVLQVSVAFLAAGLVLFLFANTRFKNTLTI